MKRNIWILVAVAMVWALAGCAEDGDDASDAGADGGDELELLELTPCPDAYHSSEEGVASQTNCRLSDSCTAETKYVRLQIHADLDTFPSAGDYPVAPYGTAEVGTTRAYYVPDASDESTGETASSGTVTVDSVDVADDVLNSVTVTVDVPFTTGRVSGTFICPIE